MRQVIFILFILSVTCQSAQAQGNCDTALFDKATGYLGQKSFDTAISLFTKVIEDCPAFTVAYVNRGMGYYYKGDTIKANTDFTTAITVAKAKYKISMMIAGALFQFEDYTNAYTYFAKAAEARPAAAEPWFKMGRCLWLGRIPVLLGKYKGDYMADPEYKSHLKSDILTLFNKATTLDSTGNYEYFYYTGMFHANFNDNAEALKYYEKSLEIHPVIKAYKACAELCRVLKLNDKACEYIKQWALYINPQEEMNAFEKKEYAEKFCKELGVKN